MPSPASFNPFLIQVLAFFCVFCVGFAAACFARMVIPSGKKSARSKSFTAFCVFLSFSVILYTVLIFCTKSLFCFSEFSAKYPGYYKILMSVFAAAAIISFFWKILLPVSFVIYIAFSFFTHYVLVSVFGPQNATIPISVDENSKIDSFSLVSCHLPDTLLLPVKRNWFSPAGEIPESWTKGGRFLSSAPVKAYVDGVVLKNLTAPRKFPIPETEVFPCLYSAHIDFEDDELVCRIVRDL